MLATYLRLVKFFIHLAASTNKEDRTRIESSNTSPMKMNLPFGGHFQHLRNFRHLGRRNGIAINMLFTRMRSLMASKRSESTTPVLMTSRALSWHLVRL